MWSSVKQSAQQSARTDRISAVCLTKRRRECLLFTFTTCKERDDASKDINVVVPLTFLRKTFVGESTVDLNHSEMFTKGHWRRLSNMHANRVVRIERRKCVFASSLPTGQCTVHISDDFQRNNYECFSLHVI